MMAYPYDGKRIILALQIDHSRVAGYFAAHWGNKDFDPPSPYASVVLAAGEHDIGWWEWEMCPSTLNDKGFPLDYHANLGAYVLENYATTDELQQKATAAAKKSLQLKVIGTNGLYERFMKN